MGPAEGRLSVLLVKKDIDNENLPEGTELGSLGRQVLPAEGRVADKDHFTGDPISSTKHLKGVTLEKEAWCFVGVDSKIRIQVWKIRSG